MRDLDEAMPAPFLQEIGSEVRRSPWGVLVAKTSPMGGLSLNEYAISLT
jgi:hypothetical protein